MKWAGLGLTWALPMRRPWGPNWSMIRPAESPAGFRNTRNYSGGYNGAFQYTAAAPAGSGATQTASWTTSGLAPGSYDVEVTWTSNGIRASNAPYRIYDGNTLLATVRVDQRHRR